VSTDSHAFAESVCPCCGLDRCRHCGVVLVGYEPWHREWCVEEVWGAESVRAEILGRRGWLTRDDLIVLLKDSFDRAEDSLNETLANEALRTLEHVGVIHFEPNEFDGDDRG
jgi:hypothetical protein